MTTDTTPTTTPFTLPNMPAININTIANSKISLMLKGDPGTGKTHTALSFPTPIFVAYAATNRATLRKHITADPSIIGNSIDSWEDFENQLKPAIMNREIPAATILVDEISSVAELMWKKIQGSRPNLTIPDYGTGGRWMRDCTKAMCSATAPRGDHPGYHIVFTTHLRDRKNEDSGELIGIVPDLMGKYAYKIEGEFDYSFLCEAEVGKDAVPTEGGTKLVLSKKFKFYTVGPNKYHKCKGGGLPPEIVVGEGESAFNILNGYWKL